MCRWLLIKPFIHGTRDIGTIKEMKAVCTLPVSSSHPWLQCNSCSCSHKGGRDLYSALPYCVKSPFLCHQCASDHVNCSHLTSVSARSFWSQAIPAWASPWTSPLWAAQWRPAWMHLGEAKSRVPKGWGSGRAHRWDLTQHTLAAPPPTPAMIPERISD